MESIHIPGASVALFVAYMDNLFIPVIIPYLCLEHYTCLGMPFYMDHATKIKNRSPYVLAHVDRWTLLISSDSCRLKEEGWPLAYLHWMSKIVDIFGVSQEVEYVCLGVFCIEVCRKREGRGILGIFEKYGWSGKEEGWWPLALHTFNEWANLLIFLVFHKR